MEGSGTQADKILEFYRSLDIGFAMPRGVTILNPYAERDVWKLVESFYRRYYGDREPRTFIFGINPGRYGGGLTGIPFTDPVLLEQSCGIANGLKKVSELSSEFIYRLIGAYGGPEAFFRSFFITALSPLGFTREGRNLNYYDDKNLCKAIEPFVVRCMQYQKKTIRSLEPVFCLGEGKNFQYFSRLNGKHQFFNRIVALPHPRWIMQYRRKRLQEFIEQYLELFWRVKNPQDMPPPDPVI